MKLIKNYIKNNKIALYLITIFPLTLYIFFWSFRIFAEIIQVEGHTDEPHGGIVLRYSILLILLHALIFFRKNLKIIKIIPLIFIFIISHLSINHIFYEQEFSLRTFFSIGFLFIILVVVNFYLELIISKLHLIIKSFLFIFTYSYLVYFLYNDTGFTLDCFNGWFHRTRYLFKENSHFALASVPTIFYYLIHFATKSGTTYKLQDKFELITFVLFLLISFQNFSVTFLVGLMLCSSVVTFFYSGKKKLMVKLISIILLIISTTIQLTKPQCYERSFQILTLKNDNKIVVEINNKLVDTLINTIETPNTLSKVNEENSLKIKKMTAIEITNSTPVEIMELTGANLSDAEAIIEKAKNNEEDSIALEEMMMKSIEESNTHLMSAIIEKAKNSEEDSIALEEMMMKSIEESNTHFNFKEVKKMTIADIRSSDPEKIVQLTGLSLTAASNLINNAGIISDNFTNISDIENIKSENLSNIEGINEKIAQTLIEDTKRLSKNSMNQNISLKQPKRVSMSIEVFIVSLKVAYNSILTRPFGYGFNNYKFAHTEHIDKIKLVDVTVKKNNFHDGSTNFSKIITEFGIFGILLFIYLFVIFLRKKDKNKIFLFLSFIIIMQFLRGVGYFNAAFLLIMLVYILYNSRKLRIFKKLVI